MEKIAWIGTGVMGHSMCAHIIKAGYEVNVYTRTKSKADDLVAAGAVWCESAAEAARGSKYIFSIVGYPEDVRETMFGPDGVLENAPKNSYVIDMTTSTPSLAEDIFSEGKDRSIHCLDAPVSGGDTGAKNGTLAIMVGGEKADFETVLPIFKLMGENIAYMGTAGKGQHTKMCNQILIAGTMIGVVESLLYSYKAGMDLQEVIDVIGKGAASSWSINNLGPRIAKGNFDPGFFIKHFVKDMRIALDEARRMTLSLPGLSLVQQFYTAAMAMGYEDLGTQGLYKVLEKMNGVD